MQQGKARVAGPAVIVALDFPSAHEALAMADRLDPALCRVKVGKELFTRCGPSIVRDLQARGFELFLDLKFHDIPNTVAGAVAAAVDLGVWMANVHALGGRRMMEAAARASAGSGTLLTAVTVLTSHRAEDLPEVGIAVSPADEVLALGRLAMEAGLDGLVCSAQESLALRGALGSQPLLVTPGIRMPGDAADDQSRTATPADAIRQGVSYLVMGRPVTRAADPVGVLRTINADIAGIR